MHESKFIDRSRFCQIQWSDNTQTVEKKNSEADRSDDSAERVGESRPGDEVKPFWIFDPSIGLRTGFGFSIRKSKNKKAFGLAPAVLLWAHSFPADAQQAEKIFRIGFLDNSTASGIAVLVEAFRQELRKLGWIEGKNITIEYRFAEQKNERLPELAADLVRLNVDLIVVTGEPSALAAKKATTTIPIVMANAADPVGAGLVASLARPGGNVTGLSSLATELNTKS